MRTLNKGMAARYQQENHVTRYPVILYRSVGITGNDYVGKHAIRLFTAFTATCAAAYRINSDSANCMRQVAAHSLRRLVSRSFIRCYPEIQRMGTRVMSTISECIMFTVLTVMAVETLRESGLVQKRGRGPS